MFLRATTTALSLACLLASDATINNKVQAFAPPTTTTTTSSRKLVKFVKSDSHQPLVPNWKEYLNQQQQQQHQQQPRHVSPLFALSENNDSDDQAEPQQHPQRTNNRWAIRQRIRKLLMRTTLVLSFVTVTLSPLAPLWMRVKPAQASAPIMAAPKAEDLDPGNEAIKRHEKQLTKQRQAEMDATALKARQIEAKQGAAARGKFEKSIQAQKEAAAAAKQTGLVQLKRDLLDQGVDPFCDIEGQRQMILYQKGVDLAEVSGTPFNIEKLNQERSPKKSQKFKKAPHRDMIKLMVQDMKNRGMDPLEYFEANKEQTLSILDMPFQQAVTMVTQYKANMEQYGQITQPKEGELSLKEQQAQRKADPKAQQEALKQQQAEEKARLKAEQIRRKAEAKAEKERVRAQANAEKEQAKAEAKAEKERVKADAKAAKEQAKRAKDEAKAAAAAGLAAGAAAVGAGVNAGAAAMESAAGADIPSLGQATASDAFDAQDVIPNSQGAVPTKSATTTSKGSSLMDKVKSLDIIPASAVVVGIGAGAYGITMYRQKSTNEEEERQRQFKLLMEGGGGDSAGSSRRSSSSSVMDVDVDLDELDDFAESTPAAKSEPVSEPASPPTPTAAAPAVPKKRRLGIFKAKKDGRQTDLSSLVGPKAQAPEFATLLGKILTFGAPGRFPNALSILGSDMPMEEFDLEKANELLINSRSEANLEIEQSAEIFANVVNCMLIDIVDLASSSLKEKESKLTVDALNIVVDFMQHAASLYDSVAEGVTITPVTYSGSLGKAKLEQMYSKYAVGGMMNTDNMTDDFDDRVALLQDVFAINEKKAEGLMMKAMQKQMVEMMKNGGEGMEDMMKGMGMDPSMADAMGGLGGGEGGDMDPAQIKAMLLELKGAKDRGEVSGEELEQVKTMFKEAMGTSLDDLMKDADEGSPEDRELLELMKSVLDD